MKKDHLNSFVNDYAVRCFRDVADQDYITARVCFREGLMIQFNWMALQAVEKYLKAILLFNRVSSSKISHSLKKAYEEVVKIEGLEFSLPEKDIKFIEYLDQTGSNRYLTTAHWNKGDEIFSLDRVVWLIRRWCQDLNREIPIEKDPNTGCVTKSRRKLDLEKEKFTQYETTPHLFKLVGGHLEKVLSTRQHPQRSSLIWQNCFYSLKKRNTLTFPGRMNAINPPQILHPEIFEELSKYIKFNKAEKTAFSELLKQTIKNK
ncbi:HEPN domain-containing protein [Marinomonas shanghaiensis]|uniref:HEPN domain-containing protein n=1 Tax=Marinomonas shanghaiensis TaxID=2202418 RepID=UPI003A94A08D